MRTRSRSSTSPSRRAAVALILLTIVTSLSFTMLDQRHVLEPVKALLSRPEEALAGAFTNVGNGIRGLGERLRSPADLRAENQRLQAENARLLADRARMKELERENEQLTAQVNFAKRFPNLQLLPARVISRDPKSRDKFFIINRGSDDGVQVGMAAVSPDFLVGLVTAVEPKSARVTLIIDESMHVGVQLQDDPRTPGILDGEWQKGGRLTMKYVDRTVDVKPNAPIITSGLTQRVPQGILVGYAVSSKKDTQSDSQTIEVWPYANFDALESVTIILTPQR